MGSGNRALRLWNSIISKLLCKFVPCASFLVWLSLPAWGQQKQNQPVVNKNTAQAVLHISAYIVPVAFSPPSNLSQGTNAAVTYDLRSPNVQMDVTEETRPFPVSGDAARKETTGVSELTTRTIVVR